MKLKNEFLSQQQLYDIMLTKGIALFKTQPMLGLIKPLPFSRQTRDLLLFSTKLEYDYASFRYESTQPIIYMRFQTAEKTSFTGI